MAVITVVDIESRKFSGYEEPELPSGHWIGEGASVGDATGGDNSLQINFTPAGNLRNSQYYSLEEMMLLHGDTSTLFVQMLIANLDTGFSSLTGLNHTIPIVGNEGAQGGALTPVGRLIKLFLGQQTTPNSQSGITYTVDNTNAVALTVRIGGYIWSARSTSRSGGPQRPTNGLYSL